MPQAGPRVIGSYEKDSDAGGMDCRIKSGNDAV